MVQMKILNTMLNALYLTVYQNVMIITSFEPKYSGINDYNLDDLYIKFLNYCLRVSYYDIKNLYIGNCLKIML